MLAVITFHATETEHHSHPDRYPPHSRNFLSVAEVATLLGKSKNRLSEAIKLGKIPAYRIGKDYRIDGAELANYLEARRTAA